MTPSTQSPGEGELIARLREEANVYASKMDRASCIETEAADTIQRLTDRVARMEEERRLDREAWAAVYNGYQVNHTSKWCRDQARSLLSEEGGTDHSPFRPSASIPSRGSDAPAAPGEVGP